MKLGSILRNDGVGQAKQSEVIYCHILIFLDTFFLLSKL